MEFDGNLVKWLRRARLLEGAQRPIRMRFACVGEDVNDILMPQYVAGTEAVCASMDYEVWCVAGTASLQTKKFIGLPVAIDFVTDRGTLRRIHGLVTSVAAGDSDGGLCAYKLTVRDALSVMEMNVRTRIFRKMSELDIASLIIREWRTSNGVLGSAFELEFADGMRAGEYPAREFTMQYNESDAAFIRRLLRRRGISWFYRAKQADSRQAANGSPVHSMVLFDRSHQLKQSAAGSVRYHRGGATEESDTLSSWAGVRLLQPGRAERFSWDYKYPIGRFAMATACRADMRQGDAGDALSAGMEDFQIASPHLGDSPDDFRRLGELVVQRSELASKCFIAHGTVRAFCVGEYFALKGHPEIDAHRPDEREFVITSLTIGVRNNFPTEITEKLNQLFRHSRWMRRNDMDAAPAAAERSHCQITAVRRTVAIVPAFNFRTDVPSPPVQSAVVIGPEGEEVHCDPMGRVLVTFPGAHSESKRQSYSADPDDALGNSTWVRVASNWAGDGPGSAHQCGTLGLPRVGTEVLIGFVNGDPDKPIIIGQLYNGYAEPPALSKGGALPANRYLSGIKSREVRGGRANQLRFDDSPGRINAQVASDHGASQLNLGFLVHALSDGHGEERGQGAELRSDHAVAVRGGEGALISAALSEEAQGQQLDCAELTGLLDELRKVSRQLAELAEQHSRDQPSGEALAGLVDRARKLAAGGQAIVAVSGPAGIIAGSGQNVAIGAQTDIDMLSGGNMALATAGHLMMRAALDVSLFANELGIRMVAAKGPVTLQAQEDTVEILAKKVLELISSTDWINIKAREGVRIYGGGSELEVSAAGIKGYTNGKHEIYAADHQTFPKQRRESQFTGEIPHHEVCIPCLLKAAQAHGALVEVV